MDDTSESSVLAAECLRDWFRMFPPTSVFFRLWRGWNNDGAAKGKNFRSPSSVRWRVAARTVRESR